MKKIYGIMTTDATGFHFLLPVQYTSVEEAEKAYAWFKEHPYYFHKDHSFEIVCFSLMDDFIAPMSEEEYQDYLHQLDEADDYASREN